MLSGRIRAAHRAFDRSRIADAKRHEAVATLRGTISRALLATCHGDTATARSVLRATEATTNHAMHDLRGRLLTALGGMAEQKGRLDDARADYESAVACLSPESAETVSLQRRMSRLGRPRPKDRHPSDPLSIYYTWPPHPVKETDDGDDAPAVDLSFQQRRSQQRARNR